MVRGCPRGCPWGFLQEQVEEVQQEQGEGCFPREGGVREVSMRVPKGKDRGPQGRDPQSTRGSGIPAAPNSRQLRQRQFLHLHDPAQEQESPGTGKKPSATRAGPKGARPRPVASTYQQHRCSPEGPWLGSVPFGSAGLRRAQFGWARSSAKLRCPPCIYSAGVVLGAAHGGAVPIRAVLSAVPCRALGPGRAVLSGAEQRRAVLSRVTAVPPPPRLPGQPWLLVSPRPRGSAVGWPCVPTD